MKLHRFFFIATAALVLALSSSQAGEPATSTADVLSTYRLRNPDASVLREVAERYEIVRRDGRDFEGVAPKAEAGRLRQLAPKAELLDPDISATIKNQLRQFALASVSGDSGYHDFEQVQAWLNGIEAAHPQNAKVVRYGQSRQGRPLLALRLSQDVARETKPALMITAATHGDELITVEVLMDLVNQLVNGYGKDARFSKMLLKHDLYFIPVVNPDGFVNVERYDNGRDPNRSYPYPGHETAAPTASIAAVIEFFKSHQIIGSIDFHAYGELVMYPWAYTYDRVEPSAGERFNKVTGDMASTNNYKFGPISEVIYVAPGSSADYYFWQGHSFSLGIEIGRTKAPSPSQIPSYVQSQSESTWRFIESF